MFCKGNCESRSRSGHSYDITLNANSKCGVGNIGNSSYMLVTAMFRPLDVAIP